VIGRKNLLKFFEHNTVWGNNYGLLKAVSCPKK